MGFFFPVKNCKFAPANMANPLAQIKNKYSKELALFEKEFKQSTKTNVSLLDTVMGYVIKRKGKQVRPLFVLLSAQLFGDLDAKSYRAASMVELLHTATLAHDDVVDNSYQRRGFFSINALWKNKIAVLVGDYLLSRGLLLAIDHKDYDLLDIMSTAVKAMSEGELLQLEKARKLDITEEVYFNIIDGKTASLISSCCALGAASKGQNKQVVNDLALFGTKVGLAFQIKDDIFDYGTSDIGKPLAIDLKEKKMTLPLIHTLNMCSKAERKKVIRTFKKKKISQEDIKTIIGLVNQYGGIPYAEKKMYTLRDEAKKIIEPHLKNNDLLDLVDFVVDRTK